MGGFFSPPQNPEPFVPSGQDAFDVPPPSFRLIGQALGTGLKDVGAIGTLATNLIDTVAKVLAYVLGWILSKLLCIVAFLIDFVNRVDDAAAPGLDAVARNSLAHVFQIPIAGAGKQRLTRSSDFQGAADNIGKDVMAALIAGVGQTPGSPIKPTSAPSEQFLAKITRIGIEGWVEGALTEAISLGQFEGVMQLVPLMSDVLGLGRLSRRVLAPPLKVLVEDPYTWKLNLDYRPTLLSASEAVRQLLRGRKDRAWLDDHLGKQGYSPDFIEALINQNTLQLSISDVDYLRSHGYYSDDTALQTLKNQGWDEISAKNLLYIAEQKRLDVYNKQLLDDSITAFQNGEIDQGQLHNIVLNSNLPTEEQNFLENIAVTKRLLNPKHLTLSEVQTLIKAHIMNLDDLRQWMTRENYPLDEQTLLELWLFGQIQNADQAAAAKKQKQIDAAAAAIAKQQAAELKAAQAAAKAQVAGVSLADYQQLVKLGQRTFADYKAFLTKLQLPAQSVTDLVDLLHAQITAQQTAQQQHDALVAESDQKHVPLSTIESNVINGTLSIAEFQTWLQQQEYTAQDVQLATDYVQQKIDAKAAAAKSKQDAAGAAAAKGISLPQLERAARLGLTTVDAYAAALDSAGFDATSRDLMVGILQAQLAADQAAAELRKSAASKATAAKVSLAQFETAVISGIKTMDDYRAQLNLLGFSPDDIDTLSSLLQLRVDHAADVAAAHAAAALALQNRGLSLAQIETAVKLGVMTIDQYSSALAGAGFAQDSTTILSTSLLAEVAKIKAAERKQAAAAAKLATKGLSLAQQEQLVLAGLATLDSYQAYLSAQGFTPADSAALVSLLALKVAQSNTAAATHQAADQAASARHISLASEEKAVVQGIRTMDDYRALLAQLGFNDIDTSTLVALLQAKIDAAAGSANPAAPAPA